MRNKTKQEQRNQNAETKRRSRSLKTSWLKQHYGIASADGLLAAVYAGKLKIVKA